MSDEGINNNEQIEQTVDRLLEEKLACRIDQLLDEKIDQKMKQLSDRKDMDINKNKTAIRDGGKRMDLICCRGKQHLMEFSGWFFAIYFIYVIGLWLCDVFDLTCYLTNLPQVTIISRIIIIALMMLLCLKVRKYVTIQRVKFDLLFYIAAAFIILFGLFKGIIPDTVCDVQNYHILAQIPGFRNYFDQSFAPGDFQLFGFILPDRLFYPFRVILGYRMGTIFNSIIMVLIYAQVINLLRLLCGEKLLSVRAKCNKMKFGFLWAWLFSESFLAFIIVFYHDVVLQTATYLVDLLPIPFALELLRLIIKKEESSKLEVGYFALVSGFLVGMKMTNVVFVIPMLVIFIIKNRKIISLKLFFSCGIIFILPVSVYMIYNAYSTGNPVFPYFNTLFHSDYFLIENFKDHRWGPSNFLEVVLWPIYMVFRPDYRQSEIPNMWPYALLCGYVAALYFVYKAIKTKNQYRTELTVVIIFVSSLFLWAVTTGLVRYFIFGILIDGMLFVMLFSALFNSKFIKLKRIIAFTLLLIVTVQPIMSFLDDIKGREWSWRELDKASYLSNFQYVFRDRSFVPEKISGKDNIFLMSYGAMGSVAYLIDHDSPIIFYSYIIGKLSNTELRNQNIEKVFQYLKNEDYDVYDIGYQGYPSIEAHMERLTQYGFYAKSAEYLDSNVLIGKNSVLLYKLGVLPDGISNAVYYADIDGKDTFSIDAENAGQIKNIELSVGLTSCLGWFSEPFVFTIQATDGQTTKTVLTKQVEEGEFYNLNESIDLSGLTGSIKLKFILSDQDGNVVENIDPYRLAIINPQISH